MCRVKSSDQAWRTAGLNVSTSTFFQPIRLGQLIGGKRLAEPHFRVPQKVRRMARLFGAGLGEVVRRHFHRLGLLGAQGETQRAVFDVRLALADGDNCRLHLLHGTLEPFVRGVLDAAWPQMPVNIAIGEAGPVGPHRRFDEFDIVGGHPRRKLLGDSRCRDPLGVADFQQARMVGVRAGVSVDGGG